MYVFSPKDSFSITIDANGEGEDDEAKKARFSNPKLYTRGPVEKLTLIN